MKKVSQETLTLLRVVQSLHKDSSKRFPSVEEQDFWRRGLRIVLKEMDRKGLKGNSHYYLSDILARGIPTLRILKRVQYELTHLDLRGHEQDREFYLNSARWLAEKIRKRIEENQRVASMEPLNRLLSPEEQATWRQHLELLYREMQQVPELVGTTDYNTIGVWRTAVRDLADLRGIHTSLHVLLSDLEEDVSGSKFGPSGKVRALVHWMGKEIEKLAVQMIHDTTSSLVKELHHLGGIVERVDKTPSIVTIIFKAFGDRRCLLSVSLFSSGQGWLQYRMVMEVGVFQQEGDNLPFIWNRMEQELASGEERARHVE